MIKSIILLFISSVILFLIGYSFIFNPCKVIAKFISLTKYKEGTFFYKLLSNDSNVPWLRIVGIAIMILALLLVLGMIILFFNNRNK